jgi:hypothetical protein
MRVFISWSGERSRKVAELLRTWTQCVIQATKPWISSEIDRGAIWFSEVNKILQESALGIICLTNDNKLKPWILFEAGALAKGLSNTRVCTFLVDLQPADIDDPLAQFNHTLPNHDSMYKLVLTVNNHLPEDQKLDPTVLARAFETYWPQFELQFNQTLESVPSNVNTPPKNANDLLTELVVQNRTILHRLTVIEQNSANSYVTPSEFRPSLLAGMYEKFLNQSDVKDNMKLAQEHIYNLLNRSPNLERVVVLNKLMSDFNLSAEEAKSVIDEARRELNRTKIPS